MGENGRRSVSGIRELVGKVMAAPGLDAKRVVCDMRNRYEMKKRLYKVYECIIESLKEGRRSVEEKMEAGGNP